MDNKIEIDNQPIRHPFCYDSSITQEEIDELVDELMGYPIFEDTITDFNFDFKKYLN